MGYKAWHLSLILLLVFLLSCKPAQETKQTTSSTQPSESSKSSTEDTSAHSPTEHDTAAPPAETKPQAVLAETNTAEAYINLGISYSKDGQYEAAIKAYKQAVNLLEEDSAEIHYNFGHAYMMMDDEDSALKEYRILCTMDTDSAEHLYAFATSKALSDQRNRFFVQVGAYKKIDNAYRMLKKLKSLSLYAFIHREGSFNIVRLAGIKTVQGGRDTIKKLNRALNVEAYLLNHTH